jgi:hypothetical protein
MKDIIDTFGDGGGLLQGATHVWQQFSKAIPLSTVGTNLGDNPLIFAYAPGGT